MTGDVRLISMASLKGFGLGGLNMLSKKKESPSSTGSVSNTGSKGVYNFKIPTSVNAGAYKLKLEMTLANNSIIEDTSDNFFWISATP